MGKPVLPAKSCVKKFGDCFLREAKVSEAFAIRFADELVCPLHHALTLFETLNFIDVRRALVCLSVLESTFYVLLCYMSHQLATEKFTYFYR